MRVLVGVRCPARNRGPHPGGAKESEGRSMRTPTIYPAETAARPLCRCGCGRPVVRMPSGQMLLYYSSACRSRAYRAKGAHGVDDENEAPKREDVQRRIKMDALSVSTLPAGPRPSRCVVCRFLSASHGCSHPRLDFARWGWERAPLIKARGSARGDADERPRRPGTAGGGIRWRERRRRRRGLADRRQVQRWRAGR